jgi:AcrR family transcriptional regulator
MSQTDRPDPRIARNRARALATAVELLTTEGRDALTQARVAVESGVSRATVYRIWPDRHRLLIDALGHLVAMAHTDPAGVDAVRDLANEILSLAREMDGHLSSVITMLLEQAQHDPEMADVLDQLAGEGARVARAILNQAHRQGRLRPGLTVDTAVSVVMGAVMHRQLVLRKRSSRAFALDLARLVLVEQ